MMLIVQDAEPPTCLAVYAGASETRSCTGGAQSPWLATAGAFATTRVGRNVGLQARRLL